MAKNKLIKVKGTDEVISYLNEEGKNFHNEFKNEMITQMKAVSREVQLDMNNAIKDGPVSFTSNSLLYFFNKRPTGVTCTILVKGIQAQYLHPIIVKPETIDKFVNTSDAKLSRQGNISGLRSNLKSGKYKVVEHKGIKRIIDTKKKSDRVIAVKTDKKRHIAYDFYEETNNKILDHINNIKGQFTIRK